MFLMGAAIWWSDSPNEAVNLGRTAMQAGDLPRAIKEYRFGLRQFPDNADLQADLLAARTMVPAPHPSLDGWHYQISLHSIFWLFVILVVIGAIAAAKHFTSRPRWAGWVAAIVMALAAVVTGIGWKILADAERENIYTDVVSTPTMLREGNGESYMPVLDTPLPPGCEVTTKHYRGDWVQVTLANGTTGWLPARSLVK